MNAIKLDQAVSQQLFQVLTKASLEGLSAGAVLHGKVQAFENGLLFIKLLDGTAFSAKAPEGFSTQTGAPITLELGERVNDQITARIVQNEPSQSGISQDQPLIQDSIMNHIKALGGAPSDKLVAGVLSLLKEEPSLPLNQASFLVANQMDNQPEMVKMLQKLTDQEFQLHQNLDSLKESLVEGLKLSGTSLRQQVLEPLVISQSMDELSQGLEQVLKGQPIEQKEALVQNVRELLTRTLLTEMSRSAKTGEAVQPNVVPDEKAIHSIGMEKSALEGLFSEVKAKFPSLEQEAWDSLLIKIQKSLEDIHTQSKSLLKEENTLAKELLTKLFDKAVIKVGNGMIEEPNLQDKARALREVIDFSQKALNQMDARSQELSLPPLKEIDQAFRFFNQVTSYDSMLQLPVKINQQNTTGELYVMKRKSGRRKLDAENFTLFLSLKTESLGRIESFLNASRKTITISFRVENEELIKVVKENHRALYDSLLKKGYKLAEMKCRVLEKDEAHLLNAAGKAQEALGLDVRVDLKI